MCQYCWGECEAGGGGGPGMSLLPLVTRLRRLYKRALGKAGVGITDASTPQAKTNTPDTPLSPPPDSPDSVVRAGASPVHLEKGGVRVLLFRECDTRGKKLLYDSKTVVQVPLGDGAPHNAPPASKTLFKGSWGGAGASAAQQSRSSASAKTQHKGETYAEISDGYGYQVRPQHLITHYYYFITYCLLRKC